MFLAPGEVFAGFTIERELGAGGMGVVYLARHPRLPRNVALKLLRTDLGSDPSFVGRFRREAETVARLDHPNIVSIDDSGAEDGQLWISMRFIDGSTASEALALEPAGLSPERVVRIVERVAAALDFAHRHRVVHRDVKPANILLTQDQDDGDERVYLTDFGVAKAMDEIEAQATALTTAGGVVATLDYAAPEQIEGKQLDGRCDVYALGCVLYKLLTGVIPFPGETLAAKVYARMHGVPPAPSEKVPDLPSDFDRVVATALAMNPDERYQTCKALAVASRAALGSPARGMTSTVRIDPPGPEATRSLTMGQITGPSVTYARPRRNGRRRAWIAVGAVVVIAAATLAAVTLGRRDQVAGTAGAPLRTSLSSPPPATSTPPANSTPPASGTAGPVPVAGLPQSAPLKPDVIVVSRQYQGKWGLYRIDASTGTVGAVISRTSSDHPQNPIIGAQRGSLVYLQGGANADDSSIRTSAADGTGDRLLFTNPKACRSIGRPAWNRANPQQLAINCTTANGPTILQIVTLGGKTVSSLDTGGLQIIDDLSFAPDGSEVLYWGSANPKAGDGGLYVQSVQPGSKPRSITPPTGRDADCDFSPDGRRVVFRRVLPAAQGGQAHIAVVGAGGGAVTVLPATGQGPVFSPDGRQIAYKDEATRPDGSKKTEIFILTAAAPGDAHELAVDDPGTVGGSPIWGPR